MDTPRIPRSRETLSKEPTKIFGLVVYLFISGFGIHRLLSRTALVCAAAALLAVTTQLAAQAPARINYQAVAREADSGVELANREVYIICKIISGGPNGNIVYQEAHENTSTNRFGLFNIQIGGGNTLAGNFDNIDWAGNDCWLEIDLDAGEGLETIGAMQFVSVPYALHAKSADNVDDADANPNNELVDALEFNSDNYILTLSEAGITHTADFSEMLNNNSSAGIESVDFSPTDSSLTIMSDGTPYSVNLGWLTGDMDISNELIEQIDFDTSEKILRIREGGVNHFLDLSSLGASGGSITSVDFDQANSELNITDPASTFSVNLSALIDDADADPANELLTDFAFNEGDNTISVTDGGGTRTVNLAALSEDDDADPTNELLTDVDFDEDASELSITDAGNTFSVNLAALINDADADMTNELITAVDFNPLNNRIRIQEGGNNFLMDLTALSNAQGNDDDPTNELLTDVNFDEDASELSITDAGNTFSVNLAALIDDADADPNNELITAADFDPGNNTVRIQEGGNDFILDLTALSNAEGNDDDATNELIDNVTFNETTSELTVSEAGNEYTVNLASLINDADSDPTNELQTLGQVLAYGVTPGDAAGSGISNLADPVDAQDAATKTFVENVPISGDVTGTAADTKVQALQGVAVSDAAPTDGQVLRYSATDTKWIPVSPSAAGLSVPQYYAIDPADFVGMRGESEDKYNIALFEDDNSFVTILKENEGSEMIAPLHLPHGAVLRDLDVVWRKTAFYNNVYISIERKNIYNNGKATLGSWDSEYELTSGALRNERINFGALPLDQRTVDLSQYSYRIIARFNTDSDYGEPSDANIRLYGARIRYGY